MNWYVVSTRPHQEARAAQHLLRQGFAPWLPQARTVRRHARKVESIAIPLFPGYLFVRFDAAAQPWRAINGTFGVRGLVCCGDRPLPVPDSFVGALRARQESDGLFSLPVEALRPGDKVRFVEGPFAECVGTLLRADDGDRIWLLLDILGRPVTTAASRRDLIAA